MGYFPTFVILQIFQGNIYLARTYLQPHFSNGVFSNVYLSAGTPRGKRCRPPIPVMGVADAFQFCLCASIVLDISLTTKNKAFQTSMKIEDLFDLFYDFGREDI